MLANNSVHSKSFLIDFHTHTFRSFDAFTSDDEILECCKKKGISAIAITEHDRRCKIDKEKFLDNGVYVISGREYTCVKGSHIIGLFVDGDIKKGSSRTEIFEHILNQNGLIMLPHPWKPGSGYFEHYEEDEYLHKVRLIELYNGGWDSKSSHSDITRIARTYNMLQVGASDSHKAVQIGYYVSDYGDINLEESLLKDIIEFQDPILRVDSKFKSPPRKNNAIQQHKIYQRLVLLVPNWLKRPLKLFLYRYRMADFRPSSANYISVISGGTNDN